MNSSLKIVLNIIVFIFLVRIPYLSYLVKIKLYHSKDQITILTYLLKAHFSSKHSAVSQSKA